MPARAGIQCLGVAFAGGNNLDSRFRGNDGIWRRVAVTYVTVIADGVTQEALNIRTFISRLLSSRTTTHANPPQASDGAALWRPMILEFGIV